MCERRVYVVIVGWLASGVNNNNLTNCKAFCFALLCFVLLSSVQFSSVPFPSVSILFVSTVEIELSLSYSINGYN